MEKKEGYRYGLTAVDVFSRNGFLIPLKAIDAAEIVSALRHRLLPMGLGKPGLFLFERRP